MHETGHGLMITHQSGGLLMATYGPACVAVWSQKPTRTLFDIQRGQLAAEALRRPGRQLFLCVVSAKADPPEQDVRNASAAMITDLGPKLASCACVIEGTGFRAAITRTVLTGISLMIRAPMPLAFFEGVPQACTWFEARTRGGEIRGLPEALVSARQSP